MNDHAWYEVVEGPTLEQGDLILQCPVPHIAVEAFPLEEQIPIDVSPHNLIVLTQSCDLVNDKLPEVLLGLVQSYAEVVEIEREYGNTYPDSRKWRREALRGNLPSFAVIPRRTENEPQLPWSLVNFHHLFTLPKTYLEAFVAQAGPRLRLISPYREHLAQAFARYVMRVGLPTLMSDFEEKG